MLEHLSTLRWDMRWLRDKPMESCRSEKATMVILSPSFLPFFQFFSSTLIALRLYFLTLARFAWPCNWCCSMIYVWSDDAMTSGRWAVFWYDVHTTDGHTVIGFVSHPIQQSNGKWAERLKVETVEKVAYFSQYMNISVSTLLVQVDLQSKYV